MTKIVKFKNGLNRKTKLSEIGIKIGFTGDFSACLLSEGADFNIHEAINLLPVKTIRIILTDIILLKV